MVSARVTLSQGSCKPAGISHWQGGKTSAPFASDKPAHGQEAMRDCTRGRQTKNVPACSHSKARDAGRPLPARDSGLHDDQGIHARLLSDIQDPVESSHDLNKGTHRAGLPREYEKENRHSHSDKNCVATADYLARRSW